MANPFPNEEELYERIRKEKIAISRDVWDLLYNRIGDDVTAINLLCQYYLTNSESVPIQEARKILIYTRDIKNTLNKAIKSESNGSLFPQFKEDGWLHPIVQDMFTHYIGNDVYMINLIVEDTIDPAEPHDISLELSQKILNHTHTIREFMERLRKATFAF